MPSFWGTYQRESGRGFTYCYTASWSLVQSTIVFDSTVTREEMIIARPRGQLGFRPDADVETLVVEAVQSAIESSQVE
jgi:hypothetical protein